MKMESSIAWNNLTPFSCILIIYAWTYHQICYSLSELDAFIYFSALLADFIVCFSVAWGCSVVRALIYLLLSLSDRYCLSTQFNMLHAGGTEFEWWMATSVPLGGASISVIHSVNPFCIYLG